MRHILRALVLVLAIGVPAFAQDTIADSPIGFAGFEGNELTVGSTIDDPAKVRITAPITEHGGGGGVVSFNLHKFLDGVAFGGQQVEMAMLRVEQAEDVRGSFIPKGEFNFLLNDGSGDDDAAMTKPLAFTAHAITRLDTGIARDLAERIAPYLPGGVDERPPFKMLSADGSLELILQNGDAVNFVIYDLRRPEGDQAIWSILTGWIHHP